MKRRWLLAALAALVLTGVFGCRREPEQPPSEYVLYFLTDGEQEHGPALGTQPYAAEEGQTPTPGQLVQALLKGPTSETLRTPFPRGVSMQSCDWDPENPGNVQVELSERYGELTDISLTLADYSIVLTLSQLDGVETVEVISDGYTISYRSHQLLSGQEALLTDEQIP